MRCWDQDTLEVGPRNPRHTVPTCVPQSDLFKDGGLTLTIGRYLVCNLGEGSSDLRVATQRRAEESSRPGSVHTY